MRKLTNLTGYRVPPSRKAVAVQIKKERIEGKRRGGLKQEKENYKKKERTRWGRWSKRQVREKEVTTGDSGMRASSRLTCIQFRSASGFSSSFSLFLIPPILIAPFPLPNVSLKSRPASTFLSILLLFLFFSLLPLFFFLSSHFFLFLDHYNTVRRIPVPAWLNPIIYSFLRGRERSVTHK